ncbi:hypothetical protein PIB30_004643 [Stylosanthes scabra]|uniref:Uncharacterized protein n=1 Tax=Stylosanthes scabra TaxID=79078 RepID=A0ABU6Q3K4_9FABA|nr:hypothetical protein [Stylosanthes scabra]
MAVCRVLMNLCNPATDSELRQTTWVESVAPCHGSSFSKPLGGIRGRVPRIQLGRATTINSKWWSSSEDERRAKMAEAEVGVRDMRRRSKASRLGMSGLGGEWPRILLPVIVLLNIRWFKHDVMPVEDTWGHKSGISSCRYMSPLNPKPSVIRSDFLD